MNPTEHAEPKKQVHLKLYIVEFAYNTFVNRTTGKSPLEIIYAFKTRQPIDLSPIDDHYRASESASAFASHVHELYKEISDRTAHNNANYKLS